MRITSSIIKRTALDNLDRNLQAVVEAQRKISSGVKVEIASDDPTAASGTMRAQTSLRAIEQYQRNISSSGARLDVEESVLDRLTQTMDRAKELALQEGGSTASANTRMIAKSEIDQLLASVQSLANTRHEGEFLFGGNTSDVQPITSLTPPFTAAPPTGSRQNEIQSGMFIKTNHNGSEVFLDTGALAALEELSRALGSNDATGIQLSASSIDRAVTGVQAMLGEVGVRSGQLQITSSNLEALSVQLDSQRSILQDTEVEKTVIELAQRQMAYQAAMLATSRLMSLSLADYLR